MYEEDPLPLKKRRLSSWELLQCPDLKYIKQSIALLVEKKPSADSILAEILDFKNSVQMYQAEVKELKQTVTTLCVDIVNKENNTMKEMLQDL